ncbi:uracil-DNA glycosylase [Aerococcus urinaehominis]|uniref:Uracil-DNA glycosylase n=1 Tax=Aerococcus urinaehominis TaxID=128944 RepID=A0A109RH51_9LACT|nr:uracil-DNA glycosylase [Aerococcus urinaehominis]AMB99801.1 uracil-DNA glycosylase [Aerococcus urinaehominis]SDM08527.1 Uracil-DNA glycosylase [Aerococcus urinaehominis]
MIPQLEGLVWQDRLAACLAQPKIKQLADFVAQERAHYTVYPPSRDVFHAYQLTDYDQVKVVILGQDPYHGPNQAQGLAFSVQRGVKVPPSLRNIYQELASDLGIAPAQHGDLTSWAQQGVFLLNTVLTVRAGEANSHRGQGWELVTDETIRQLNQRDQPIVFILWGKPAQTKRALIDERRHAVITAPHPSPLSAYRGFFGSRPFSQTNKILEASGQKPIDWQLPE